MKKSPKVLSVLLVSLFILPTFYLAAPAVSFAQEVTTGDSSDTDLPTIDSPEQIERLIGSITNWMYTIFLALAVIMIIYAAFVYLTSGGGENVSKAHKMLLYAIVAIAVAMLSKGVTTVVSSLIENA